MNREFSSVGEISFQVFVSAAVGVGIVTLILFSGGQTITLRLMASGAVVGVSIWAWCFSLTHLWWQRLSALSKALRFPFFAAIFLMGSVCGWLTSMALNRWLLGVRHASSPEGVVISLGITGVLTLVVGGAITTIQMLQERLAESIAELKEKEYTERELETAASIQKRLLPPSELEIDGVRVCSRHLPARQVAGDFYDVYRAENGCVVIAIADVVGKGLGASLIMASVKAILPLVGAGKSVSETLTQLNQRLSVELGPREFVALSLVQVNPADGTVQLGNAGLPNPYLLRPGEEPDALSVGGPRLPLGAVKKVKYEVLETKLRTGDRLLMLTDGAPEASVGNDEPLGYERLEELITQVDTGDGLDLDRLVSDVRSATQDDRGDDWTFVVVDRA